MATTTTNRAYKVIDRNELKAKLDRGEKFHFWNVLTPEYFKQDKTIPGSKWVPVNVLESRLPSLGAGKTDPVVVYCGSFQCPSSRQAAQQLTALGFTDVSVYEGGVADWEEAGFPLAPSKE